MVGGRPGTAADSPAAPSATLKAISERQGRGGASLVIEASEPVPYVTTRPDPLTVLLDFRNVGAEGVANAVAAKKTGPIAGVAVEARRVDGRAGVARPHLAGAAGRAPRAQRAQHRRRRLRAQRATARRT